MPLCLLLCLLLSLAFPASVFAASPDQVLVLYNADWTEDLDGSEPGQDSLEVASHYVAMHTDPATGKKPYLLGLSSNDPLDSRLNEPRLKEQSNDNIFGLRYTGPGEGPTLDDKRQPVYLLDNVEVLLQDKPGRKIDWGSVVFKIGEGPDEAAATTIWADDKAQSDAIRATRLPDTGAVARFTIRQSKPYYLWYSARDTTGKIVARRSGLRLWSSANFISSETGPDGARDDRNYLHDIERPVQEFLTNPANALPDGTPLKDHILYIVVCYGLPRTVESAYGMLRGITGRLSNFGDGSSLDSRLSTIFYHFDRIRLAGKMLMAPASINLDPVEQGPKGRILINRMHIRAMQQMHSYKHPKSFVPARYGHRPGADEKKHYNDPRAVWHPIYKPGQAMHPHFTSQWRASQHPAGFVYSVTRIDAGHPNDAKRLIDNAVYATKHFTTDMGEAAFKRTNSAPCGPSSQFAIDELKVLGFKLPADHKGSPDLVPRANMFFGLVKDSPNYLEDGAVVGYEGFYPGAVAYTVKSGNGWRRDTTQFTEYMPKLLESGATVTGGLSGEGHIHTASWWDDKILFHHLFRGYDLGECFLMSGAGLLDWVTTSIGDPLYRPDLSKTTRDTAPPKLARKDDIQVRIATAGGVCYAVITCRLDASPQQPEMADVTVEYWKDGAPRQTAREMFFSAEPRLILRNLEPNSTYQYKLVLTDPYGNRFDSEEAFGPLTLATPDAPDAKPLLDLDFSRRPTRRQVENQAKTPAIGYIEGDNPGEIIGDGFLNLGGKAEVSVSTGENTVDPGDDILPAEQGQIRVAFELSESNSRSLRTTILRTQGLSLGTIRYRGAKQIGQMSFLVGGGEVRSHEPLDLQYGRRYDVILRWRREPVTREIYLRLPDGREVLIGANNRFAWHTQELGGQLRLGRAIGKYYSLSILDNAPPSTEAANFLYPRRLDLEALELE